MEPIDRDASGCLPEPRHRSTSCSPVARTSTKACRTRRDLRWSSLHPAWSCRSAPGSCRCRCWRTAPDD